MLICIIYNKITISAIFTIPIPIISINKQTVSAELGGQFLSNVWLMGMLSFIGVELIIFIRYRKFKLDDASFKIELQRYQRQALCRHIADQSAYLSLME